MKTLSDIYEEIVKKNLLENDSTEVLGTKSFIVRAMCTTSENDEPTPQEFTVQAASPQQAKTAAMAMSKEMGHTSCRPSGVELVPNSGEELNDYGSGKDLNSDNSRTDGKVKPTDVSGELDNLDA